jgi:hypothetical protein
MRIQKPGTWLPGRSLAALLLIAVAGFCLVGAAPMAAADAGCDGHYASGKVCGQSGPFEPLLGVIRNAPPVQRAESPAAWLAVKHHAEPVLQFHAPPSSPRAPPLPIR